MERKDTKERRETAGESQSQTKSDEDQSERTKEQEMTVKTISFID